MSSLTRHRIPKLWEAILVERASRKNLFWLASAGRSSLDSLGLVSDFCFGPVEG